MTLSPEATPILIESFSGAAAGMKYPRTGQDGAGRVVFLSFPLDAVSPTASAPNNRATLLGNIISFLVPGINGHGSVALDSPAYNIPSVATVEIGDSNLAGQGTAFVTFHSTTHTNGIAVTLHETSVPGLFRGGIDLVADTNSPPAGNLPVKSGDTVWVDYFDASAGTTVRATATVDTAPPAISAVHAVPDYTQATITWNTPEPADSTVEFGTSRPLNRNTSDPGRVTSHEVTLTSLSPDTTYYFQVLSRDTAGNLTLDDNHTNLYFFTTLRPILPPWSDTMNNGATNWSVSTSPESQVDWILTSTATNALGTNNAYSQPFAWYTNPKGALIDAGETFLISPAIYLTNGNVATLTFWHNYDFFQGSEWDILEYGEVLLITDDNPTAYTTLATYSDDASFGWEQQVIDLTPFAGHLVYLVWDYELFSLDTRERPGWEVDNVSVTVSTVAPGTVRITNNLWQTVYVLTGPQYLKGTGLGTTITNAPPGKYVLEFADVPYYLTPAPQTNTLTSGNTIVLQGNYTFPDVNHNDISDLWETNFFGNVSPNRTHTTSTFGAGVSDYARFIAGSNPNDPPPHFRLTAQILSNTLCRLTWPANPGQQFRLHYSTNAITWNLYATNWLETNRFDLPLTSLGKRAFFRVETWMPAPTPNLPSDLRLSVQQLPTGPIRLVWPSAIGHGYRVLGSTNGLVWTPVSDWIRAGSVVTTYQLPPTAPATAHLFRLQVAP